MAGPSTEISNKIVFPTFKRPFVLRVEVYTVSFGTALTWTLVFSL